MSTYSDIKIGIIQFPGSNTERETFMACNRAGMQPIEFLWNHNPKKLSTLGGYVIVGGFSYEDRSRAGVIAALDPIMKQLEIESNKGKPILGICNGAQILVESGMIPGLENGEVGMALTDNKRVRNGNVIGVGYYNTWVHLKMSAASNRCAFTGNLQREQIIKIPLAHGEGRFVMTKSLLNKIIANNQTVYRYCDEKGEILDEFPINPNGSIYNLAAVCNNRGNIMAMMPHPERTKNGDLIFSSMKDFIKKNYPTTNHVLKHNHEKIKLKNYKADESCAQWVVNMIITDNEASSVQNSLNKLGYDIVLTRQTHWEITTEGEKDNILNKIQASGELYNSNKEYLDKIKRNDKTISILVRQKEDMHERLKKESLTDRFQVQGLVKLKRGVVWNLSSKRGNIETIINEVLETNILFNQISHECYRIN